MKNEVLIKRIEGILLFTLTAFLVLVFCSYSEYDPCFEFAKVSFPSSSSIHNLGGLTGAYLSGLLLFLLGRGSYIIPLATFLWGWHKIWGKEQFSLKLNLSGALLLLFCISTLLALTVKTTERAYLSGGILGLWFSKGLSGLLGKEGSLILVISLIVVGLLLSLGFILRENFLFFLSFFRRKKITRFRVKRRRKPIPKKEGGLPSGGRDGGFNLPSLSLLEEPELQAEEKEKADLERYAKVMEETIADFNLEAKVTEISQGPVVTMYELMLAPGITPHRIVGLADNIAMALKAPNVRIIAPLPGKSTVGVEVPNRKATLVYLKEILLSPEFKAATSKLCLCLGKDILDKPLLADLKMMPHLLIAGATGSGKTVCINSVIISLLFQNTPSELRFLMIDPKMVELTPYNNIPHLLLPVITNKENSVRALKWLVGEMGRRYNLFSEKGVRNIEAYNKVEKGNPLFYVVVIIDELADLMLIARDEIENSIMRLSQLARATGIHLILATQRPSVDVITGVIKANLPTRISFQVSSKVDSRTILDMNGAEKLLGRGDMLFLSSTTYRPIRAQGSLVSDTEIEEVCNFLRSQGEPSYFPEILEEEKERIVGEKKDPLFEEAVEIVFETHLASISYLQRRLRIGFNRAARLIEEMEAEGIVGPYREGKPREILKK
ncbi:MAG: DNA translocase FtsK [Candidatus Omnitrophica bacterium]|nr:DNA translocase FtsK [Candidatus Omnitrophota bacterium]